MARAARAGSERAHQLARTSERRRAGSSSLREVMHMTALSRSPVHALMAGSGFLKSHRVGYRVARGAESPSASWLLGVTRAQPGPKDAGSPWITRPRVLALTYRWRSNMIIYRQLQP